MSDKKKFYVSRWIANEQYVIVDAVDADDAMRIAELAEEEWIDTDRIEVVGYDTVEEVNDADED